MSQLIRSWINKLSECEHFKWITTPSSRVSPHLLSQTGHTQRSHIRGSPLIMPLVAWWVFEWITSDWRTLIWCSVFAFSAWVATRLKSLFRRPLLSRKELRNSQVLVQAFFLPYIKISQFYRALTHSERSYARTHVCAYAHFYKINKQKKEKNNI